MWLNTIPQKLWAQIVSIKFQKHLSSKSQQSIMHKLFQKIEEGIFSNSYTKPALHSYQNPNTYAGKILKKLWEYQTRKYICQNIYIYTQIKYYTYHNYYMFTTYHKKTKNDLMGLSQVGIMFKNQPI